MFLWLTSPVSNTLTFRTSLTFFDVSPPDPNNGSRTFIQVPATGVLHVEQGQAHNTVLEAQPSTGGSLVYYMTTVNDVYAFLRTGVVAQDPNFPMPANFPTTQADLSQITSFAASKGITFPDPNALAIMVKSSWVEAASLPNLSNYITMTATVPTYDMSDPTKKKWVQNGTKTVQLALVGMHVVGSATGHPEAIWATFEHEDNAPRGQYQYVDNNSTTVTVNRGTTKNWVFNSTPPLGPFNTQKMTFTNSAPPTIDATTSNTISPSNTIRWKAFGAAFSGLPNPLVSSPADSNTQVISINDSVNSQLLFSGVADVRSRYVMTGATWTIGGAAPTTFFQKSGNIVGTSVLSNSTMETDTQGSGTSLSNNEDGCLTCHRTNNFSVSHDFGNLQPLTTFITNPGYTLGSFPGNVFVALPSPGTLAFVPDLISVIPLNGFTRSVEFSATSLPTGVSAIFSKSGSPRATRLMLVVSPQAPVGVSNVEITGTSGNLRATTTLSLNISRK